MNLLFLCIMAYVKFFEEKNVLLFFCAGKKRLLSAGTIQNLFVLFHFVSLHSQIKGFQ